MIKEKPIKSTNMRVGKALDETIKIYKLKAADIAAKSGINAQDISKYRHTDRDMRASTLFQIADALPLQAKVYFMNLCFFSDENIKN